MQLSKALQPSGRVTSAILHPLHRIFTVGLPITFLVLQVALKLVLGEAYRQLVREDGIFEYLTVLVYAVGLGFALAASAMLWRRGERLFSLFFILVALAFLAVGGEEISWGQRIFQVQSPELFQAGNLQHETNVHNFLTRHKLHALYILFSSALAFAWLIIPFGLRYAPARTRVFLGERAWMLAPDRRLMLFFLPCTLLYFYLERDIISHDKVNATLASTFGAGVQLHNPLGAFIIHRDQEPIELLLGAGLVLFVITVVWQLRRPRQTKV